MKKDAANQRLFNQNGGERGIRTPARVAPTNGLANRPLQPLGYFSVPYNNIKGQETSQERFFAFYQMEKDKVKLTPDLI